ncbi:uncharacterized protein LOC110280425 [Arachis duranensis]|uniref:Uncharacterized protein LOC110280425 n=1 Tax=Arachis duranensis TaxID=130453 RepID=A0A6P5NMP9_ARADU|nr:uncharacterized protein LOC110280425 [Arachis duranensis]
MNRTVTGRLDRTGNRPVRIKQRRFPFFLKNKKVKTQPPSPTHTKHPFLRTSKQLALRLPRRRDPKPNFVAGTAAAVRGCLRLRGLLLPLSQRHTARASLLAPAGEAAVRGFQLLRRRLAVDVLLWWKEKSFMARGRLRFSDCWPARFSGGLRHGGLGRGHACLPPPISCN